MTRTVDGTQLFNDAIKRIQQLEKLNAALAAEIDRMRPVVEAAQKVCEPALIHASLLPLQRAVRDYEKQRA